MLKKIKAKIKLRKDRRIFEAIIFKYMENKIKPDEVKMVEMLWHYLKEDMLVYVMDLSHFIKWRRMHPTTNTEYFLDKFSDKTFRICFRLLLKRCGVNNNVK